MSSTPRSDQPFGPRRVARALFVAGFIALCVWLLWGFIPALVWALIIAIATWPLRVRCIRVGLQPASAAALMTIALGIVVMLPFVLFGAEIVREASSIADIVDQARQGRLEAPDWLGGVPIAGSYAVDWWNAHVATPEVSKHLFDQSRPSDAFQFGRDIVRWIIRRLAIFGFTLLTLFFLYKDGPEIATEAESLIVRLFGSTAKRYGMFSVSAVRATVNGLVFVGLAEGALLGIGYAICGVPHPVTFAVATAILGIVPFGAPVILVIASMTLVASSRVAIGLVLLGVGLVAIFIADHTVRPALIGGSIRLPFLWALLGVFGGLEGFGVVGLFIGPAILAVALTMWREAVQKTATPEVI